MNKEKLRLKDDDRAILFHIAIALVSDDFRFSLVPYKGERTMLEEPNERGTTKQDIERWLHSPDLTGIAVFPGKLSNLLVIECDPMRDIESCPFLYEMDNMATRTPEGKINIFYEYPNKKKLAKYPIVKNLRSGRLWTIDVYSKLLVEGSEVFLPPSLNQLGKPHEWRTWPTPLKQIPDYILDNILSCQTAMLNNINR